MSDEFSDLPNVSKQGTPAIASTFGYNDPEDNGVGAWGDVTNDPNVHGVSLPRHVLQQQFGDENLAHGQLVRVTNPQTGQSVVAPILDKGPANWVEARDQNNAIDLTHATNQAIGGTGKTPVQYSFVPQGTNASDPFANLPNAKNTDDPFASLPNVSKGFAGSEDSASGGKITTIPAASPQDLAAAGETPLVSSTPAQKPWWESLRDEFEASAAKGAINTVGGVLRAVSQNQSLADTAAQQVAQQQKDLADAISSGADPEMIQRIQSDLESTKQQLQNYQASNPQNIVPLQGIADAAKSGANIASEASTEAGEIYNANPNDTSIAAGVGRGLGNITAMAPTVMLGGLPAVALQGGGQAYADAYDNTVAKMQQEGNTDAKAIDQVAHQAGSDAAVQTIPQLGAYLVGGKLASTAVGALLKNASPLIQGLAGGAAATAANMGASATIRAASGQPILPTAESTVQDVAFGALHGVNTGIEAAKRPVQLAPSPNPIVNDREAQINAVADQQMKPFDKAIRANQFQQLTKKAKDISDQLGSLEQDDPAKEDLQKQAAIISQQMEDLRNGKPVVIQPEEPIQGDERFAPPAPEDSDEAAHGESSQEAQPVTTEEPKPEETLPDDVFEPKKNEGSLFSEDSIPFNLAGEVDRASATPEEQRRSDLEARTKADNEKAQTSLFTPEKVQDLKEKAQDALKSIDLPSKRKGAPKVGMFGEDPVIAHLLENPIKSKSKSGGQSEYDDAPRLPVSHNQIYGGSQTIDQAHQALIDEGLMPHDSSISDLWQHIADASKSSVEYSKALKEQEAKQRSEAKSEKALEALRDTNPEAYKAEIDKREAKAKRLAQIEAIQTADRAWIRRQAEGGYLNLEPIAEYGKAIYEKGMTFADWAKRMISDLGDKVKDVLSKLWEGYKSLGNAGSIGSRADDVGKQDKRGQDIRNKLVPKPIQKIQNTIVHAFKSRSAKDAISYLRDAGDNAARLYAERDGNTIENGIKRTFKGNTPLAKDALTFIIESKDDPANLDEMEEKIRASDNADSKWGQRALKSIDFAKNNYGKFDDIADQYRESTMHEVVQENAQGIDTPLRDGYVPHQQDVDDQELFGGATAGSPTEFRKNRSYDTFADSIAAGIDPKSLDAVALLRKRLANGQRSINYRLWIDSLKGTIDPHSGLPIATKIEVVKRPDGSSYYNTPKGYHTENLAGQQVAIKNGYEGVVSALTDPSTWQKSMAGRLVQNTSATGKSLTLALDTFHLGRVAIWDSLIKSLGIKTFKLPLPSYSKGVTLLDHSVPELQKMIANGEIPRSWAKGLLENKRLLDLAVKTGYNVGGISDSLHQDWIHKIPALGHFNQWLFDQFQRGAMSESWLLEFQRYRNAYPHAAESDVARMVSKDLNARFGNFGRQGLLKSKTAQDTARFLFLAPQWNEGLIRTELGAVSQTAKAALDAVAGKRLFAGVLARSVGAMLAAQFLANQIINYATRGKPTWENPEEGMGAKLSAWIPDLIGHGPGFFLNPMSLAAETTHLLIKSFERTGDVVQTATDYLRSRSSVPMRPVWDAVTKKTSLGQFIKPGQMWNQMLSDSVPVPISGGAAYAGAKELATGKEEEQFPGQFQKQALSSFGIKTDQAPSDEQRIRALVRHYRTENNIPSDYAGANESPYQNLNEALQVGNMDNAHSAMEELLKTKTPDSIQNYYKKYYPKMTLIQKSSTQQDFYDSLTPEQQGAYDRAKDKRQNIADKALDVLDDVQQ